MVWLNLESDYPETYTLTSTDGGETFTGEDTYQDGTGCATAFEVQALRTIFEPAEPEAAERTPLHHPRWRGCPRSGCRAA